METLRPNAIGVQGPTPITEMRKVIGDAMRGGARLLISPTGREVALDATLGQIVDGNHVLTLELRCSGVGGGEEEDDSALDAVFTVLWWCLWVMGCARWHRFPERWNNGVQCSFSWRVAATRKEWQRL
mmetsp:Transcript_61041/g.144210  ORF Transcript_61041/g.144210 Transcript_61041/m.144210 type:complete len:128 (-) Transcript_61041:146-529(-)